MTFSSVQLIASLKLSLYAVMTIRTATDGNKASNKFKNTLFATP
ncbi:MAG: hypothetical protein ACTTH7_10300 [Treponema sp.]